MKRILSLVAAGALAVGAAPAQTGIVDVSVLQDNVGWNMAFFFDMQQDVRVETEGTLEGFSLRIATSAIGVGQPVSIFLGVGPHLPSAVPAWSGMVFASSVFNWEWVFADCSAAGLNFAVGDVFTIRVGDGVVASGGDLTGNSGFPNPFYIEPFYEDLGFRNTDRLTFETFVLPTPPTLSVTGTCPGSVTFDVTNGTGNYFLVYGAAGSSTVRGVTLAIANPALATTMGATLSAVVPPAACGKTVQAVDMVNLVASNAVVL